MDDPSPDIDTRAYGCHGWGCLIVVVLAVVLVIPERHGRLRRRVAEARAA